MISKLHYITQGKDAAENLATLKRACLAGCDLIQLRVKGATADEIRPYAQEAKAFCTTHKTTFILNDFPELAKEIGADGVHLGLTDMPTDEARALLGDDFIIGGTANTLDDVLFHIKNGVNYVGVGPFRFTTTKKQLSPILGLEGYQDIRKALLIRELDIPVYAIGGITLEDIPAIMQTGVHGIALSGLITHSENPTETINLIKESFVEA